MWQRESASQTGRLMCRWGLNHQSTWEHLLGPGRGLSSMSPAQLRSGSPRWEKARSQGGIPSKLKGWRSRGLRKAKVQRNPQVGRQTDAAPKSIAFHPDSKLQTHCMLVIWPQTSYPSLGFPIRTKESIKSPPPSIFSRSKESIGTFLVTQWIGIRLANAEEMGSFPGSGRFHMPRGSRTRAPQLLSPSSRAGEPQLLSPHAAATEACTLCSPMNHSS